MKYPYHNTAIDQWQWALSQSSQDFEAAAVAATKIQHPDGRYPAGIYKWQSLRTHNRHVQELDCCEPQKPDAFWCPALAGDVQCPTKGYLGFMDVTVPQQGRPR